MIFIARVCIFNFVILHCLERKISTLFHAQLMVKCHCGGVNATSLVTSHDKIFLSVLMRHSVPNLTSPFFSKKKVEKFKIQPLKIAQHEDLTKFQRPNF